MVIFAGHDPRCLAEFTSGEPLGPIVLVELVVNAGRICGCECGAGPECHGQYDRTIGCGRDSAGVMS